MKQAAFNPKQTSIAARLGAAAAALLCLGLLFATPASAVYEQVDTFGGTPGELQLGSGNPIEVSERWPEEVQLGGTGGMAVNHTGAGGVPKGTLYAATSMGTGTARIARYNPDGSFSEAWTFKGTLGGAPEERCGPEGDPTKPTCKSRAEGGGGVDVDVDQNTGDVYFLDGFSGGSVAGVKRVHVFTPDGSKLIAEFGEQAAIGETIATSPGKIHEAGVSGGIAVYGKGDVYLYDQVVLGGFAYRLMKFEPQSPGDYEHYLYAGPSRDITLKEELHAPVADAAGNLYVQSQTAVEEFDSSQPSSPPLCKFEFPLGQIQSIAVDQFSGEVFFYSRADKKIHVLSPCQEGKFTEAGKISVSPSRNQIPGLAFDPVHQFDPNRLAGTLYAASLGGEGGKTEGTPPNIKGESALGYVFAHPAELSPQVLSESAGHVTATTAELGAQINPKGPPTRYAFQYLTQAEYEANAPTERFAGARESPLGGGLLGEGPQVLSAGAALSGLEPDTAYHYRAVATSHCSEEEPAKVCEGAGADQSFRTFPAEAPGLPDHRAYELVSPTEKEGGQVLVADPTITQRLGAAYNRFPMQSTPDGEAIVYEGTPFAAGEGAVIESQYIAHRNAKTGWRTSDPTPQLMQTSKGGLGQGYQAFDTALTRALIKQQSPEFSPEAPAGFDNLYAQPISNPLALSPLMQGEPLNRPASGTGEFKLTYAGSSADLSRVFFEANDALTEETPLAPEAEDGGAGKQNLYEWAEGQLSLVNVLPGDTETKAGASFGAGGANSISKDGSRAFWSAESGQVYVRIDGEETTEIPDHSGKFLAASTDGSKVLLTDGVLYDLEAKTTTDLTEGKGGFLGITGQGDDLSHVYFVDTAVLTEEENDHKAKAQAGGFNLYAWEAGGDARFVGTLAKDDKGGPFETGAIADWTALPSKRTAEASPGGRYLAFLSKAPLTGDNTGLCEGARIVGFKDGPCREAYLYDSATGKLNCASCNPTGLPSQGNSVLRIISGVPPSRPQPRYLTDQGRLYFDSEDSLSFFDTNGRFEDVYQYEPEGVGTCKREAGCLNLISAGAEPTDSNLLAIDETGRSVFFTTRDQLVLKDRDDLTDLYVAREDGGIPGESETSRGECQGEACQPLYAPPNDPTPGSSSFEGAGNVDQKKQTKKHKKKHAKKKHAHRRAAKHNRGGVK